MNMRLQLQKFHVKNIDFADQTIFQDGTLHIKKDEIEALLAEDTHFSKVEIELAHPGESVRILQVADVVEPRARRDGGDFPGVLSKTVNIVGNGITDVLSGASVVVLDECGNNCGVTHDAIGCVIDMSSAMADYSIFSNTHNICVITYAAEGVDPCQPNYKIASKRAGIKAAVYLAQSCRNSEPDEVEVYELPPITEISKGMENLPKVVYVFNFYRYYLKNEYAIYGETYPLLPSVLLHPNEVFDGAVVNPYLNANLASPATIETYGIQNHPVIKELYRRHGKELCFLGVIPTVAQAEVNSVTSQTNMAIKLALSLGADGVVLTKATGGSPQLDVAEFAISASAFGIKSVLLLDDIAGKSPDGEFRANGIMYSDKRAENIVNTGNVSEVFNLTAVERIIGRPVPGDHGELTRSRMALVGQGSQLGNTRLIEVEY